jgi:hypothetical protein
LSSESTAWQFGQERWAEVMVRSSQVQKTTIIPTHAFGRPDAVRTPLAWPVNACMQLV